ncbi:MAG: Cysteine desulfurase IscS 2 [Methanonatronarchaeales archaeon]|nr:Cysteine desulfurase IscS 2 [Methanonatronarchaeales archaeon]
MREVLINGVKYGRIEWTISMTQVYLDNASAAKPFPEVLEAMRPYQEEMYGVPSSDYGHTFDLQAIDAVEDARESAASAMGAEPDRVVFTSGATESNNLAVKGAAYRAGGGHVVVSEVEHSSVLNSAESLSSCGFDVTRVGVDGEGFVDPAEVEGAIRDDTILVSVMHANNEIGTIQELEAIGDVCEDSDVLFHSDASAAFTKTPLDVDAAKLDLASFSGNQVHGPKGTGALYVRNDRKISRVLEGGDEEMGVRPGTVNVPGVVGFGKAVDISEELDYGEVSRLRDRLIDGVLEMDRTRLNGSRENRLPTNVNTTFLDIEGESILLHLDMRGVAVSTGSACYSKKLAPSHVLTAVGLSPEVSHGSIRFSLSVNNSEEEIDYTLEQLREVVSSLREISAMGRKRSVPGGR